MPTYTGRRCLPLAERPAKTAGAQPRCPNRSRRLRVPAAQPPSASTAVVCCRKSGTKVSTNVSFCNNVHQIVKNLPSQISSAQFASHCFFAVASVFSPHIYEWKSPKSVLQNQACLSIPVRSSPKRLSTCIRAMGYHLVFSIKRTLFSRKRDFADNIPWSGAETGDPTRRITGADLVGNAWCISVCGSSANLCSPQPVGTSCP